MHSTVRLSGIFGLRALVLILCLGLFAGCASRGGKTYNDGEVRQMHGLTYGTVVNVSEVTVEEDPSYAGTAIGGVAGGVIGSMFGHGSGKVLATLGGAAIGALAGTGGEFATRRYKATELTIDLEDGETVVVVQGNDEFFRTGDKVRILTSNEGRARVQHR